MLADKTKGANSISSVTALSSRWYWGNAILLIETWREEKYIENIYEVTLESTESHCKMLKTLND